MIGGHDANAVGAAVVGGTIGGGGSSDDPNAVGGNFATVGGGRGNMADGVDGTIGGGIDTT